MAVSDRLYIDEDDRPLYDSLKDEDIFKGKSNKDLFFTAMAFGFNSSVHIPIKNKLEYVRIEYIKEEDEAIINAIAVQDKKGDVNVLLDTQKVYDLAEEYAHAGIKLLSDIKKNAQYGTLYKQLEREIYNIKI